MHKIPFYLYELSTLFHAYWSRGNEDKRYKFIENEKIKRKEEEPGANNEDGDAASGSSPSGNAPEAEYIGFTGLAT